jgi:hypothetical protein
MQNELQRRTNHLTNSKPEMGNAGWIVRLVVTRLLDAILGLEADEVCTLESHLLIAAQTQYLQGKNVSSSVLKM